MMQRHPISITPENEYDKYVKSADGKPIKLLRVSISHSDTPDIAPMQKFEIEVSKTHCSSVCDVAHRLPIQKMDVTCDGKPLVFYSGYKNAGLAESFAASIHGCTISNTPGGNFLNTFDLFSQCDYRRARKPWEKLSLNFANNATGPVYVFAKNAPATGVFNLVEYPALISNKAVTEIIFLESHEKSDQCSLADAPLNDAVISAAQSGMMRGAAKAIQYGMIKSNYSNASAYAGSRGVYYAGLFALRFANQMRVSHDISTAACHAASDTVSVALMNEGFELIKQVAKTAIDAGYEKSGYCLNAVCNILGALSYAIYTHASDAYEVAACMVAGTAMEVAVEKIGCSAVDALTEPSDAIRLSNHPNTLFSVSRVGPPLKTLRPCAP